MLKFRWRLVVNNQICAIILEDYYYQLLTPWNPTDGMDDMDFDTSAMCSHKGRYYKPGQDFYEECIHRCICTERLEVHCVAIECPVTFGLDLIDPNCLDWDLDPDYVPTPPK